MTDTLSREARSRNMAAIRGRDTAPEVYLRGLLFARGLRYRKNTPRLPGRPDLHLARWKAVIFVNGCFWHRHRDCPYAAVPRSNTGFWEEKFARNVRRDRQVREDLARLGLRTLTVWECTLRRMRRDRAEEERVLADILNFLKGNERELEL